MHPVVAHDALPAYHAIDTVHLCRVLLPLYMQYMVRYHQAEIDAFRCVVLTWWWWLCGCWTYILSITVPVLMCA